MSNKIKVNTIINGTVEFELRDAEGKLLGRLKINERSISFRRPAAHRYERIQYEQLPYVFEVHGRRSSRNDSN